VAEESLESDRNSQRPFGSPDGDRSELNDPLKDFIDFGGRQFRNGLGMDPADRKVRVIVGGKGAGKTLYLRRLQEAAAEENSVYADDWQISLPTSSEIIRVADLEKSDATETVERWQAIWKYAVLRSLVSHILCSSDPLLEAVNAEHGDALLGYCDALYPDYQEPESAYDAVRDILSTYHTKKKLGHYLADRRWMSLERLLASAIRTSPPICFYLDALDHRFQHAPRPWMLCQLGLFHTVMDFLRDPRFGARLHVVIGLRDIVFSSIQRTEHATKFVETSHIRMLDWNRDAIEYFLRHKLDGLGQEYLMGSADSRFIERWLGLREITNEVRKETEGIETYLLRHTRLIPRDVVVLGNMLCDTIDRVREHGQSFLAEEDIRAAVKRAAQRFGHEQLSIVANHVTAIAMPRGAAHHAYDDVYTTEGLEGIEGGDAYQQAIVDQLSQLIGTLRRDRFSKERLLDFANACRAKFEWVNDLPSILWQNGLLGYIEGSVMKGRTVFFATTREDNLLLPPSKVGYALHPILIDTVDGLRGVGAPVQAY
jgi:hypothetical protein